MPRKSVTFAKENREFLNKVFVCDGTYRVSINGHDMTPFFKNYVEKDALGWVTSRGRFGEQHYLEPEVIQTMLATLKSRVLWELRMAVKGKLSETKPEFEFLDIAKNTLENSSPSKRTTIFNGHDTSYD